MAAIQDLKRQIAADAFSIDGRKSPLDSTNHLEVGLHSIVIFYIEPALTCITAIEGTVDLTCEVKALQLPMLLQGVGALTLL